MSPQQNRDPRFDDLPAYALEESERMAVEELLPSSEEAFDELNELLETARA